MKTKQGIYSAIIIVAVAAVILLFLPANKTRAPEINVNSIDGRILNLNSLTGRTVLVTFWATSCSICIQEMPHLIDLYKELNRDGFEIIGIAMYYDPPNRVVELSEQKEIPYPVALDIDGNAAKAFGRIKATPTSFLIGPDGTIVQSYTGEMDIDKLRIKIKQLIKNNNTNFF